MASLSSLCFGLAVVLVATAGLATVVRAERVRDSLVTGAVLTVAVGLGLRVFGGVFKHSSAHVTWTPSWSARDIALVVAFAVGHIALGVFFLLRRTQSDRGGFMSDLEAARGRERVRLMPPVTREDVR